MMHFVCMVPGELHLHDLGVLVIEGELLSLSDEAALQSKDLWRAHGQKLLYRVLSGPLLSGAVVDQGQEAALRLRVAQLEETVAQQAATIAEQVQKLSDKEAEVRVLERRAPADAGPQLEQLMAMMAEVAKRPVVTVAGQTTVVPAAPSDPTVPMFFPTFDRPAEGSVQVKEETSEGSLGATRDRLRELRKR